LSPVGWMPEKILTLLLSLASRPKGLDVPPTAT
jgi:hypothetical protein